MKYIRTEDKIYGFVKGIVSSIEHDAELGAYSIYYFDDDKGEHMEQDGKGGCSIDSVWDDEIVAEADTIEELCDFVDIEYQDGSWETYPYEKEFRIKLLLYKAKKVFYGIRTDKGLIYVAKMNEKGELELL